MSYSVFAPEVKLIKIFDILQAVPGTGIIYCKSRKRTKEIALALSQSGIIADFYHAGLTGDERAAKQDDWIAGRTRIIVSTNAFGMGIDKPDVRTVIHADVPDCLENYYQEAGRAGRDGKKSYAVLLCQPKDIADLENNATKKFPSIESIRFTYQCVANYLQQPTGLGEGEYVEFDLNDFVKTFKLDLIETINALKILEQEEWIAFNEQVFLPARVGFTCSKQALYDFEESNPEAAELIKTLLRTYEGIFDQLVPIHERAIGITQRQTAETIKKGLQQLQRYGVIDYEPQKEKPQLYFIRNRVAANALTIDKERIAERKARYEARLRSMLNYIAEQTTCRSVITGRYFGDETITACGICDKLSPKERATTQYRRIRNDS